MTKLSGSPDQSGSTEEGARLDAVDLTYSVVVKHKVKRILKHVSFSLEPGDLCAVMGSSGAGKSTLLDILAARKRTGTWSGDVYVDSTPRSHRFAMETAYVLQADVHISTLTVEETIAYAAWTRLPEGTSVEDRQTRVEKLLSLLGLTHIRNARVGDAMTRGISGGQAKRLSIAVELVALPRLIFLDEPTSGLDSAIAFEVMSTVRGLIDSSRTCIATIHQPSKDIFALFDKLLLMSRGRLIFFGRATDAVLFFTQPELGYKFEGGYRNPAEFVLDVSSARILPEGAAVPRQPEELEVLYKSSRFYRPPSLTAQQRQGIKAAATGAGASAVIPQDEAAAGAGQGEYATGLFTQVRMLNHRAWVSRLRDTADLTANVVKMVAIGIVFGIVFYNKGDPSYPFYEDGMMTSDTNAVTSFLFAFMIACMLLNAQSIPLLCSRNMIYKREVASQAYSPLAIFVSQMTSNPPFLFAYHFLLVMLSYWLVGMKARADMFFFFLFASFAGSLIAFVTAMSIAAWVGDEGTALGVFTPQFLLFTTFTGYTIKMRDIPIYFRWITYITYPKWIFEGLMINVFQAYETDDDPEDTRSGYGDVLGEYSFHDIRREDIVWISLLFMIVFAYALYTGMQPEANQLVKVVNAADYVTVLSVSSGGTGRGSPIESAELRGRRTAVVKKNIRGTVRSSQASPELRANLMEGGDAGLNGTSNAGHGNTLADRMVVEDPLLVHQPHLSVESFAKSAGIIETAQGCRLIFHNVEYTVASKTDDKTQCTLLRGVTGYASPGEMVALMGASGAGKSTLLDVLAQRKNTGTISGSITYNGSPRLCSSAYVMQDNVHLGVLTVLESIHYAAQLRLSEHMSRQAKERRVQKILDMLDLNGVKDSPVGNESLRGVSGGQLKRVSIAVEIVNLPDLMFLDEPTTGLDSCIALEVMSAVRNLANQNRTVICTIHQPGEDTYALFDSLLLLAEGRVVYFGSADGVLQYFVQSPYQFPFKQGANAADFVIAVAGSFVPAGDGRTIPAGELAAHYATTPQYQQALTVAQGGGSASPSNPLLAATPAAQVREAAATTEPSAGSGGQSGDEPPAEGNSLWFQLKILIDRRWKLQLRENERIFVPMVRETFVGLLYGAVFFQLETGDDCDENCYTDRLSLIFFSLMLMIMGHLPTISELIGDRLVFIRERGAKAYGPFVYFLSLWIPRVPVAIVTVLLYTIIAYNMCGLRAGGAHFFAFFLFMLLTNYISMFMAYTIGAVSRSVAVSLSYFPAALMLNIFYAGYLVYIPALPGWQNKWLPYVNYLRFSFQGMVLNEFQDNSDLPKSHDFIDDMGFDFISIGGCAAILLIFLGLFAAGTYLALRYVDFEER